MDREKLKKDMYKKLRARKNMAEKGPQERTYPMDHGPYQMSQGKWNSRFWTNVEACGTPPDGSAVLVWITGKDTKGQTWKGRPVVAAWYDNEGWFLDTLVEYEEYTVHAWHVLPEDYKA